MPLTNCLDCGKEHSDTALSCPQCGRPNKTLFRGSRRFPKTKLQYGIDLAIGFILSVIGLIFLSSIGEILSLPFIFTFRITFLIAASAFTVDLIRFKPGQDNDKNESASKLIYFTLGPYIRFFSMTKKSWQPWIFSAIALLIVGIPVLLLVLERFESQAFLKNSDSVVAEVSDLASDLKDCQTLEKCPEKYFQFAKVIKSYSIPQISEGFVTIVSKDNGIYKTIRTPGFPRAFSRRPALNNQEVVKEQIPIDNFEPLFNRDFTQVVETFRPDSISRVEITGVKNYRSNTSRVFRSLHRIDINGHPLVIYIASDQGFLFNPREQHLIDNQINR